MTYITCDFGDVAIRENVGLDNKWIHPFQTNVSVSKLTLDVLAYLFN